MTAPNIVNVLTMEGGLDVLNATTSLTAITTNAGASGQVYKIHSLRLTNITGNVDISTTVDVSLNRSATDYYLLNNVVIPANSVVIAIDDSEKFSLLEGDSLKISASAVSEVTAVCSYTTIED